MEAKNITTGRVLQFASLQDVKLLVGLYDFTYSADVKIKGDTTMHHVVAFKPAVELTTSNTKVELQAFENIENDDFIIQEVFFTGTLRPSGRQYHGDDYVMIYNNTDHVLYADGLTLLESYFTTVQKFNYRPNIIDTAMTVAAIYTIPGSGRDHPVKPGESLRIVDTGIDHRGLMSRKCPPISTLMAPPCPTSIVGTATPSRFLCSTIVVSRLGHWHAFPFPKNNI